MPAVGTLGESTMLAQHQLLQCHVLSIIIACLSISSPHTSTLISAFDTFLLSFHTHYTLPIKLMKHLSEKSASVVHIMPPTAPKTPFRRSSLEEAHEDRRFKCYRGVRKRAWGKWVSEIRVPKTGKRIWLGSYNAPEKAARAYDAALFCIRGEMGVFNFPDDKKPQLPEGSVRPLSKDDIQKIATNYASSASHVPSHATTLPVTAQVPSEVRPSPDVSVSTEITEVVTEHYIPTHASTESMFSVEDLQIDSFLMMDIDWINSLV